MIEEVMHKNKLLSIIISHKFKEKGCSFVTPPELDQQLAYMYYPRGKIIQAHIHNYIPRKIQYTQEVLIIKRGLLRVDFYTDRQKYLESRILGAGDVIILIMGGHGFEVLEELEMIEVKQGPYLGKEEKTCFDGLVLKGANLLSV